MKSLEIPYSHHEKWDGSGYPQGLKGNEIPISARIFAIVDVWDALLSDRPYRDAWPREVVVDYISAESGKHFDPHVVKIFLSLIRSS
jgi:response regulator RpfG family c-di-GMP phosphodiesterase